jgi:hypothetical protein
MFKPELWVILNSFYHRKFNKITKTEFWEEK